MKHLQVGMRVIVKRGGRKDFRGKIDAVSGENSIHVIEDGFYSNHDDSPFHPCQLRILRKKVKPVVEKRTPIYLTACRDIHGAWRVQNCESHAGAKIPAEGIQIQFQEVLPDIVTVTRGQLDEEADHVEFVELAKALGFEEKKFKQEEK